MPRKKETLPQPIDKKPDFHKGISKVIVSTPYALATNVIEALYKDTPITDGNQNKKGLAAGVTADEMSRQTDEVKNGDLSSIEGILTGQIHVLNHWFMRYLHLAYKNSGNSGNGTNEVMLAQYQLALKMQEQTRKTAATLGALKQPKQTSFIKQQVNNADNQQIINGPQVNQRTENILLEQPNKLMDGGRTIDTWVDTGTPATPVGDYSELEAVGAVNWTKNGRR